MLSDVLDVLRCPAHPADVDEPLVPERSTLRCAAGHSYDIARQGYVNLALRDPGTGDTAEMVRAREAWLERGHYAPLTRRVASLVAERSPDTLADVGSGPGLYLAAALDATEAAVGLALDLSRYAARTAARRHPRIGAVVADAWGPLPVRSGSIDVLLNVFAPRNGEEFVRMLRPGGLLLVVTPAVHHLAELASGLGMLSVDQQKQDRLDRSLEPWFVRAGREAERLEFELRLTHAETAELVGMGPSAWHLEPEQVGPRLARLPEPIVTTAAIDISCWSPLQP